MRNKIRTGIIILSGLLLITGIIYLMNIKKLILKVDQITQEYGTVFSLSPKDLCDSKMKDINNVKIETDAILQQNKNYYKVGEYTVTISLNKETKNIPLIIKDTVAPIIQCKEEIKIKESEKIDYSKYIKTKDLSDVSINIDDHLVNYDIPGTYDVIITAKDTSDNITKKKIKVIVKPVIITLNKEKITLKEKESFQLKVNHPAMIKWKSSNEKIATVKNGKVQAKNTGTCEIIATYKTQSVQCIVTVEKKEEVKTNKPYYIKINRKQNVVMVYNLKDELVKVMTCSTGTDTPIGTFKTSDKYTWRKLYGGVWGQYATRITGSILFHSVPYYSKNKNDLETEEYNKLGTKASLGCIRLRVCDAKWIYSHCPKKTTVIIFDGPLTVKKPVYAKITTKYDPTDQ